MIELKHITKVFNRGKINEVNCPERYQSGN